MFVTQIGVSQKGWRGVSVFSPSQNPKSNPDKCRLWIKLCGRPHSQLNPSKINKHTFVCSKHFVNGESSPETPNPVPAISGGGSAVKGRRLPTKRGIYTVSGSSVQDTTSEELSMVIETDIGCWKQEMRPPSWTGHTPR
ncbi:uncharacterized protein si:ch73-311h14.2 isoform X3 [Alosa sapidissima]|uniref:uncharacterized protein si:ch73-311h14.2 isoform X3 n=1 Tax=Alosa sapidissima TaxID=34773 RepID=UPI001C07FBBE|nr:uncharacterized protein si:ch73-311h14.2 isoform X3 [Alosa sapidissima]